MLFVFSSVRLLAKLIKSNHATIVDLIKQQIIFRGQWFLSNIPYNLTDTPSINSEKDHDRLILEINNKSYIKKTVFVYDINKNFIGKYDGVMHVQRTFNINHSIIKKYANIAGVYKGYIFSYVRLRD